MSEEQTVQLEVTLTLPETVAREAEMRGLLTAQSLEALLLAELRRRRVEQLFTAADQLAALPLPPLTEAEIEAEIEAARNEKRGAGAGSR